MTSTTGPAGYNGGNSRNGTIAKMVQTGGRGVPLKAWTL
jgi:hypothetical protein